MTMVAAWRDEESLALATDGKMADYLGPVQKLHIVRPNKVMFGIEFGGENAGKWLSECPHYKHPYPEYWRECSRVENVTELGQFIQNDLKNGSFPLDATLKLWLAGVNELGELEAFILDGVGSRATIPINNALFNNTIKNVLPNLPDQLFRDLKNSIDGKIKFSGVSALIETARKLIEICEAIQCPYISGPMQCYTIIRGKAYYRIN